MVPLLSGFVRAEFGGTLTSRDAEQLAFLIFCTLDYLPQNLKAEIWDRARISSEFVSLTKSGFLSDVSPAHSDPAYWNATIDRFLAKKTEVDWSLRARLKNEKA